MRLISLLIWKENVELQSFCQQLPVSFFYSVEGILCARLRSRFAIFLGDITDPGLRDDNVTRDKYLISNSRSGQPYLISGTSNATYVLPMWYLGIEQKYLTCSTNILEATTPETFQGCTLKVQLLNPSSHVLLRRNIYWTLKTVLWFEKLALIDSRSIGFLATIASLKKSLSVH